MVRRCCYKGSSLRRGIGPGSGHGRGRGRGTGRSDCDGNLRGSRGSSLSKSAFLGVSLKLD